VWELDLGASGNWAWGASMETGLEVSVKSRVRN